MRKDVIVPLSSDANRPSVLNQILGKIPGFAGYVEAEARQTSDRQTREYLADELQKSKRFIDQYARALVDAGRIDESLACEAARNSVDRIVQRLNSRILGSGGFFKAPRLDANRIEDVYDCDANLMDEAELLTQTTGELAIGDPDAELKFEQIRQKIDSISQMIDHRDKLLKG
jgi:hypothetical protein